MAFEPTLGLNLLHDHDIPNKYVNVTGDTMTGNLILNDSISLLLGTGSDGELFHDGTNTYFQNNTGGIIIENDAQDGDITFKVNDGGVDTTVMTIDGATGNIGIGTTSPTIGKLQIALGTGTASTRIIYATGTDSGYGIDSRLTNTDVAVVGSIYGDVTAHVRSTGAINYRASNLQVLIDSYEAQLTFNAATGVNVDTDTITVTGAVPATDTPVRMSCLVSETMPTGLAVSTTYYVIYVSATQMQLAAAPAGAAIDITATGSGTIYCWTGTAYSNTGYARGVEGSTYTRGLGTFSEVTGLAFGAGHYAAGGRDPLATITNCYAINNTMHNQPNSTITNAYGNKVNFLSANGGTWGTIYGNHVTFPTAGTITTLYGDYISASSVAATTKYGMYIGAMTGATDNYAFYAAGTTDKSYFGGNVGIGTTSPDRLFHTEVTSALTNTVQQVARLTHITSGTPATSIGLGLEFEQETAADNNEIVATIETIMTDVTATEEDADMSFKLMAAGATAAEVLRLSSVGDLTIYGNINLGEGADPADQGIVMDSSMSADERYSGITIPGTAGATLAFGDLCYLDVTAGEWLLADASAAATAGNVPLGICVDASTDGAATSMLLIGTVRSAAFPASIALGAPVYVSETAGDLTATAPVTTDSVMRRCGWAMTVEPNTILFQPSIDYITHI